MFFSRALLLHMENVQRKYMAPGLRSLGQRLYRLGGKIQGDSFVEEKRNNSLIF